MLESVLKPRALAEGERGTIRALTLPSCVSDQRDTVHPLTLPSIRARLGNGFAQLC